jgi:hypothetical protein
MQSAPVDAALLTDGAVEFFGEPGTVAMPRRCVESIWVDLRREHGQVAETTAGFVPCLFEHGAQETVAIRVLRLGRRRGRHFSDDLSVLW